ncbi:MAG: hypothetical protein E3J43_00205 [Candidatus Heimdallarchaeota archaeon]|nr:MAG: hypothetical protein E3J43_00205 [Candidatus Heimdallarchaeota archaeon]
MTDYVIIQAPKVTIAVYRWRIVITAHYTSGRKEVWIASADAFFTEKNNIFFDTAENYYKYEEEN